MKKRSSILERLTAAAELHDEAIPHLPLVEIAGEHRVLIENHMGVIAYAAEEICVRVKYGTVSVGGCNLELAHMTKGQLVISGTINKVALHRGRA